MYVYLCTPMPRLRPYSKLCGFFHKLCNYQENHVSFNSIHSSLLLLSLSLSLSHSHSHSLALALTLSHSLFSSCFNIVIYTCISFCCRYDASETSITLFNHSLIYTFSTFFTANSGLYFSVVKDRQWTSNNAISVIFCVTFLLFQLLLIRDYICTQT